MSDTDPKTGQPWELRDLGPLYNRLRDWALATDFNRLSRSFWAVGVSEIPIEDLRYLTLHTIRDAHHPNDREALCRLTLGRGTQDDRDRPSMQPWLDENGEVFPEFAAEVQPWARLLDSLGELDCSEASYVERMRKHLHYARESLAKTVDPERREEIRQQFLRAWPKMLKRLDELPDDFRVPTVEMVERADENGATHVVITVPKGTISRGGPV